MRRDCRKLQNFASTKFESHSHQPVTKKYRPSQYLDQKQDHDNTHYCICDEIKKMIQRDEQLNKSMNLSKINSNNVMQLLDKVMSKKEKHLKDQYQDRSSSVFEGKIEKSDEKVKGLMRQKNGQNTPKDTWPLDTYQINPKITNFDSVKLINYNKDNNTQINKKADFQNKQQGLSLSNQHGIRYVLRNENGDIKELHSRSNIGSDCFGRGVQKKEKDFGKEKQDEWYKAINGSDNGVEKGRESNNYTLTKKSLLDFVQEDQINHQTPHNKTNIFIPRDNKENYSYIPNSQNFANTDLNLFYQEPQQQQKLNYSDENLRNINMSLMVKNKKSDIKGKLNFDKYLDRTNHIEPIEHV